MEHTQYDNPTASSHIGLNRAIIVTAVAIMLANEKTTPVFISAAFASETWKQATVAARRVFATAEPRRSCKSCLTVIQVRQTEYTNSNAYWYENVLMSVKVCSDALQPHLYTLELYNKVFD